MLPASRIRRSDYQDYAGKTILLCGILKGPSPFFTDLARAIDGPVYFDFMSCSSYGASTESSGDIEIRKDLDNDVEGKDVLIVEDIIDTGITLSHLVPMLKERGARSVKLATLLSKPARRQVEVPVDYNGFEIPDAFSSATASTIIAATATCLTSAS